MRKVYIRRRITVCIAAILSIMAINAIVNEPEVQCEIPVVRAQSGDTMWDIAYKNCPKFRHRMDDVMSIVIKMNGKATVEVGQMVVLPWKSDK